MTYYHLINSSIFNKLNAIHTSFKQKFRNYSAVTLPALQITIDWPTVVTITKISKTSQHNLIFNRYCILYNNLLNGARIKIHSKNSFWVKLLPTYQELKCIIF